MSEFTINGDSNKPLPTTMPVMATQKKTSENNSTVLKVASIAGLVVLFGGTALFAAHKNIAGIIVTSVGGIAFAGGFIAAVTRETDNKKDKHYMPTATPMSFA